MAKNEAKLELKLVGNISGNFFVADYQRGYRWKEEVEMLLNDISEVEEGKNYCLQPIVVKKVDDKFELIDGQQRLTTLHLIQVFIKKYLPMSEIKYSISYETRKNSKNFLENLDFSFIPDNSKNIDEFFICEAAKIIKTWFEKFNKTEESKYNSANNAVMNIQKKLDEKVHVIWYEVASTENSTQLFTRLNIGKIPLTNAELIKALFLSRNSGIDDTKQLEIATQWDTIEKELRNENFWYFITNKKADAYPTRIELIFDLMAEKSSKDKERFRTFFYFNDAVNSRKDKAEVWHNILQYYQKLKEWYENFDVYHKVGYLIAAKTFSLQELLKEAENKTKSDFQQSLDEKIAQSVNFSKNYSELSYETDYASIEKLLLLFNVETIRRKHDEFMRFPFERHKKENWSLEHIHAQNSEGLNKDESRRRWLLDHKKALESFDNEDFTDLISQIDELISKIDNPNDKTNKGEIFNPLFEIIVGKLSENGETEEIHTIDNMALLSANDNSALNNSTFDVKRNKIIEMDKTIDYIPVCTRRVFLKYYTGSEKNQLHFWGKADRMAYMANMNEVLTPYLKIINREIDLC
ncbi:MAG: DUF262 domain-containing protein [Treponema sp.]|nr:DUF262 domain-containing protein [Treponema sp.]